MGRYLKEKLPFGPISSSSSFHLMPWPLQQSCVGHDTCFGLMKTDNEGLGSWVGIWKGQTDDRGSRQLAGKSLCRAAVFSMLPSQCMGGTQKWGRLCFSSAGKPAFGPQHLKMMLSWVGLAVAFWWLGSLPRGFLVVGSLPRGVGGQLCWEGKWRLGEYVHTRGQQGEKEGGEDEKLIAAKKVA